MHISVKPHSVWFCAGQVREVLRAWSAPWFIRKIITLAGKISWRERENKKTARYWKREKREDGRAAKYPPMIVQKGSVECKPVERRTDKSPGWRRRDRHPPASFNRCAARWIKNVINTGDLSQECYLSSPLSSGLDKILYTVCRKILLLSISLRGGGVSLAKAGFANNPSFSIYFYRIGPCKKSIFSRAAICPYGSLASRSDVYSKMILTGFMRRSLKDWYPQR